MYLCSNNTEFVSVNRAIIVQKESRCFDYRISPRLRLYRAQKKKWTLGQCRKNEKSNWAKKETMDGSTNHIVHHELVKASSG